jgi:hypothetical protein
MQHSDPLHVLKVLLVCNNDTELTYRDVHETFQPETETKTFSPETETLPNYSETRPTETALSRDETETRRWYVSRPSRDETSETETTYMMIYTC